MVSQALLHHFGWWLKEPGTLSTPRIQPGLAARAVYPWGTRMRCSTSQSSILHRFHISTGNKYPLPLVSTSPLPLSPLLAL